MLKIFRVSELCSIILTKILRKNFSYRKYLVFYFFCSQNVSTGKLCSILEIMLILEKKSIILKKKQQHCLQSHTDSPSVNVFN